MPDAGRPGPGKRKPGRTPRNPARRAPQGLAGLAVTLVASFAAAVLLLLLFAEDFPAALRLFFLSPFGNKYAFGNMLAAAVPLMLAGLGIGVAFASKNFNLGGEGQVYSGGLAAVAVCLALPSSPPLAVQVLAALAGAAVGAASGSVSGILKRSLGVDELISSFLLSAAVVLTVDFLIAGPFQDPSSNFQTTLAIAPALRFARILPPSGLSTGLFLALAAALLGKFAFDRTLFGYELRVFGHNVEFARYSGIDTGAYTMLPMSISGALHGLAGAAMIMGSYYKAMKGFSAGVGWSAIAVALIARNDPLAVIPSAFFFAYLEAGAKGVMVGSNVTSEIVAVVQSVIFFLVTAKIVRRSGVAKRSGIAQRSWIAKRSGVARPSGLTQRSGAIPGGGPAGAPVNSGPETEAEGASPEDAPGPAKAPSAPGKNAEAPK